MVVSASESSNEIPTVRWFIYTTLPRPIEVKCLNWKAASAKQVAEHWDANAEKTIANVALVANALGAPTVLKSEGQSLIFWLYPLSFNGLLLPYCFSLKLSSQLHIKLAIVVTAHYDYYGPGKYACAWSAALFIAMRSVLCMHLST